MINNPVDFESTFVKIFGNVDMATLSAIKNNRIRLELGGENKSTSDRIRQALYRSSQVLDYCFKNQIWFRVILWDNNEAEFFEKSHINIEECDVYFKQAIIIEEIEITILYFYYEIFPKLIIDSINTLIINYDLGESPTLSITCFFMDFQNAVLINPYDDRGLDIYCPNSNLLTDISAEFIQWV